MSSSSSPFSLYTTAVATHVGIVAAIEAVVLRNPKWVDFIRSEKYSRYAFNYLEAFVNLYSAAIFIVAPSFAAHQLTPYFDAGDPVYEHPALRLCLRLFGCTEILVGLLFYTVFSRENGKAFLASVLAGDLAHYVTYVRYCDAHPNWKEPSVFAHFVFMTLVIYTKYLFFRTLGGGGEKRRS